MADSPTTVQSVETALAVLEYLQERGEVGVTELADELGMSKGSAHAHLHTLKQQGYVVADDGRYSIGLRFLDFAHGIREREPLYDVVNEQVDALAERSGELALFTVPEGCEGVCLYAAGGDQAVRTKVHPGYRSGLHHTAVGKAILAFIPAERRDALLDASSLAAHTEATITDPEALREELATIRERGVAYNRGETIPGLTGVGAPVRHPDDEVYGALSIIGPSSRMTDDRLAELTDLIQQSVDVVEINATAL